MCVYGGGNGERGGRERGGEELSVVQCNTLHTIDKNAV